MLYHDGNVARKLSYSSVRKCFHFCSFSTFRTRCDLIDQSARDVTGQIVIIFKIILRYPTHLMCRSKMCVDNYFQKIIRRLKDIPILKLRLTNGRVSELLLCSVQNIPGKWHAHIFRIEHYFPHMTNAQNQEIFPGSTVEKREFSKIGGLSFPLHTFLIGTLLFIYQK